MTCGDCIHLCANRRYEFILRDDMEKSCGEFEDKSLYIKLPCKVGDTVWFLCDTNKLCGIFTRTEVKSATVCAMVVAVTKLIPIQVRLVIKYERKNREIVYEKAAWLGKDVFLTKEEAEKALKEREQK